MRPPPPVLLLVPPAVPRHLTGLNAGLCKRGCDANNFVISLLAKLLHNSDAVTASDLLYVVVRPRASDLQPCDKLCDSYTLWLHINQHYIPFTH
jgi:hypothetical protein